MNYLELLTGLALDRHLDIEAAAKTGSCSIRFDDTLEVAFEAEGAGDNQTLLHLHCVLADVPPVDRDAFFSRLLQLHLFGFATEHSYFGYDAIQNRIVFFKVIHLAEMTLESALYTVESFVNQALRWRAFVPELAFPRTSSDTTA